MKIFNAVTSDVKEIYGLIEIYAKEGVVLPRSLLSLYQYLQCLYVVKERGNRRSCWFTCVRGGPCRSPVVSRFAYICRERDWTYVSKPCNK